MLTNAITTSKIHAFSHNVRNKVIKTILLIIISYLQFSYTSHKEIMNRYFVKLFVE